MEITTYDDADAFLARTRAALEENEVENSLMLGICLRLHHAALTPATAPYLATASEGRELALAAVMTPPHRVILASLGGHPAPALELVARDLLDHDWSVPGVVGAAAVVDEFAAVWARNTGEACELRMYQRVYRLDRVVDRGSAPGRLRLATEADLDLVAGWILAFSQDTFPGEEPPEARSIAEDKIGSRDVYLWEDGGRPVSMATRARPTASGITVNYVYTPAELRRRGYATACVAALSQLLLDWGWKFCTLFTDLANPTSNSIYQRIGYRPVCDFHYYTFRPALQPEPRAPTTA